MFETTISKDPSFDCCPCCPNPPLMGTPLSSSHCSHETIGKESGLRIAHLQHEPFFGFRVVEGTNASFNATKGTNKNTGNVAVLPTKVMGDSCRFSMATKPLIVVRESGPARPWQAGDVQQKVAASEAKNHLLNRFHSYSHLEKLDKLETWKCEINDDKCHLYHPGNTFFITFKYGFF